MTRTLFLRLALAACVAWPSLAHAQAKDAFVEGLTQLVNVVHGTYGDEGPALQAAIDAMTRGLAAWDERVARVESGFRADVTTAPPAAVARMRATLGTVYLERGRAVAALEQFDAAATLDPLLSHVHVLRAMARERLSQSGVADAYRAAWESKRDEGTTAYLALMADPKTSGALNALWSAVVRRAESTDTSPAGFPVADLLDDASVSAPLCAPMAYADAFRAIRAGSYDEALAALKQAVAVDPLVVDRGLQSAEAKTGIAALRQKDVRVAVASLEAASTRNPESAEVQRILGMALALARQHETSLTHLREASRLNPRDERSRIAIADVLIASGKPDAALESLRETLRVMPESAEAYWQVGRVEQARGDAGAVRSFDRAATKSMVAGLGRLYAIIGQAYHAQFDLDGAARAYRQRVRMAPNDRDAHFDLAEVYRGQDKLDDARVEYLAAALLDPASAKTFGMLGQVEAAAGRDEEAIVMLRRAVTLDGGLLEARYALSRALLRQGRTEEAQAELHAYEQAQATAMDEQRRQFRDNQQKIDDVLKTR